MADSNGVQMAIDAAGGGSEGPKHLAVLLGTSVQFIYNSRRKGWFPLDRARKIAEVYQLPLADLVKDDVRRALLDNNA